MQNCIFVSAVSPLKVQAISAFDGKAKLLKEVHFFLLFTVRVMFICIQSRLCSVNMSSVAAVVVVRKANKTG